MESSTERESLLRQADHLWKMLDNMAENDVEGYQHFIKKQLQEGSQHLKPPEAVFCLSCEIDKVPFYYKQCLSSNPNLVWPDRFLSDQGSREISQTQHTSIRTGFL